jgi:hypothetical protein
MMQPVLTQQAVLILTAAGLLVFFISFVGLLGAYYESKYFLISYGLILIILLLLESIAGCLAATYPHVTVEITRALLKLSIKLYHAAEEDGTVTFAWDYTMAYMKCCGVDSYEDFKESQKWTQGNNTKTIPKACCILEGDFAKLKPKDPKCTENPSDSNSYWNKGCYKAIVEGIRESIVMVIGIGIGLVLFQLLLVISTFCLLRSLRTFQKRFPSGPE